MLGFTTIAYADVFDFPLTPQELILWSIRTKNRGISKKKYIYLGGRQKIVGTRLQRSAFAVAKWGIAHRIGNLLRFVPTIMLVGVTGTLAMNNTKEDDDIDLLVLTKPGAIWITRLLVLCMTWNRRRKRTDSQVANKVCLNMFMSVDALALPKADQDLYSAHEVLQMKPLWQRDHVYKRFLHENKWSHYFLPIAYNMNKKTSVPQYACNPIAIGFVTLFEKPARWLQMYIMSVHRTTEIVTDSVLRFHPRDARSWVKKMYAKRLAKHNIPIDKIFYHR